MLTSLFDFELPDSLIASAPANPRDSARLLVIPSPLEGEGQGEGKFFDRRIPDLLDHLQPGDVMVFNDTRVIPARLLGKRGDANIEILLHKKINDTQWRCFAKPAKKLKVGDEIKFANDFAATVQSKEDDGQVILSFLRKQESSSNDEWLHTKLAQYGLMPLPPYIEKKRLNPEHGRGISSPDPSARQMLAQDEMNYQTVYAKHEGSVAAPTAGLHFTPELLAAIDAKGVRRVHVTLHVGGGTFLPVKSDDTNEHVMHSEYAEISKDAADIINAAKRVIAVGTTSLRTLESSATADGRVQPMARETNIFITPGYRFKCVDVLMTNFHLPKSTLFMLVSAFSGLDTMKDAYAHAIRAGYRFYSYGDACLLTRKN